MDLLEWTFVLSLFLPPLAVIVGAVTLAAARCMTWVRRSDSSATPVVAAH